MLKILDVGFEVNKLEDGTFQMHGSSGLFGMSSSTSNAGKSLFEVLENHMNFYQLRNYSYNCEVKNT